MNVLIDPAWAAGLLLAILRSAAFMLASPLFPRSIPVVARVAVAISIGMFLATPIAGSLDLWRLVGAALVNLTVGVVLGFMTQLVFAMFPIAGGLIDMSAGLSMGAILDPISGVQAATFNRFFTMTALTIFLVIGGDQLMIHGLALSAQTIPLDGGLRLDADIIPYVISASETMIIAGAELALPAVAALFLTEVTMGLASRLAPTANVLILALPVRVLITIVTGTAVLTLLPAASQGSLRLLREGIVAGLRGLGVAVAP